MKFAPAKPPVPVAGRSWWCFLALATAVAGFAVVVGWAAWSAPGTPWNDARLAPSFALARGLPIYALRDSAQQLGWIYGPVFPLWFLPFAFTDNPTVALTLASLWNVFTLLSACALVLAAARVSTAGILFGVALGGLLFAVTPGTVGIFHFIHVDLLCIALGWVACAALHRAAAGGSSRWLLATALSLVLAGWTKGLVLVLLPGFVVWLWHEGRRELIWPLLFWCVVFGAAATLAIFFIFGGEEVLFNTVWFQLHNPYRTGLAEELRVRGKELVLGLWPCAALAGWAIWVRRTVVREPLGAPATSLLRLLLIAALVQLPLGVLASLKAGGGDNSLHSESYLLLCLVIVVGRTWTQLTGQSAGFRCRHGFVLSLLVALVVGAAWRDTRALAETTTLRRGEADMLALARSHPGKIYLPWNPTIMIIAEHRVYPFDDALLSLDRAGLEPPAEKIRALMSRGTLIVYPEPTQSTFALRYLVSPPSPPTSH